MRARAIAGARAVSALLRAGTVVSTLLLAAGMALSLLRPQAAAADTMLVAGLLILMATPVATLLVAMAEEAADGEWRFVAVGFLVIALLAGSLAVAFR